MHLERRERQRISPPSVGKVRARVRVRVCVSGDAHLALEEVVLVRVLAREDELALQVQQDGFQNGRSHLIKVVVVPARVATAARKQGWRRKRRGPGGQRTVWAAAWASIA